MSAIEKRLEEIGVALPAVRKPAAAFVPAVLDGDRVYTSGNTPVVDGKLAYTGQVGADCSPEDAYEAAKICAINCLAAAKEAIGDLDKVERIVKLLGFVSSAPGFFGQPQVMNGASEFLIQVFGEKGEHARSAIGVNALPGNASVEVEMIIKLKK